MTSRGWTSTFFREANKRNKGIHTASNPALNFHYPTRYVEQKIFEVKSLPQETGPIFCSALLRRTLLLFSVELSFIGNPDWISVIGGKWATRPTSSDALLYFPLLWCYCLSVCDHARVLYMAKGLMIFDLYVHMPNKSYSRFRQAH